MPVAVIVAFLLAAWFWDFWPFTNGNLRPLSYEHDYNVYAYFPDNRQVYLGPVTGLDNCGASAYAWASSNNLNRYDGWSYICCSIRKGSQCYEKQR